MVLKHLGTSDIFPRHFLWNSAAPTINLIYKENFRLELECSLVSRSIVVGDNEPSCICNSIPGPVTMIEDVGAFGRFPADYPFEQFSSPGGEMRDIGRTSQFSQAFESQTGDIGEIGIALEC